MEYDINMELEKDEICSDLEDKLIENESLIILEDPWEDEIESNDYFEQDVILLEESINKEIEINYEAIYDIIQQESLRYGFSDINIEYDTERLDTALSEFDDLNWSMDTLDDVKTSIEDLASYISDAIGLKMNPSICYYYAESEGEYGGYDSSDNTLNINEYMLYDSKEAVDTVAHEMWHAYQHEHAVNPQCARDYQYQFNFENYIEPELGQEAYENQLVEAEARAFAEQFVTRLKGGEKNRAWNKF